MLFFFFYFEPDIASIGSSLLIEKFWILQRVHELISTCHKMDCQDSETIK